MTAARLLHTLHAALCGTFIGLAVLTATTGRAEAPQQPSVDAKGNDSAERERRDQVVVGGDDIAITVGALEDVIAKQPPVLQSRYRDLEELKGLANNLLRMELIAKEAERRGFSNNMVVKRTVKDSAVQNLIRVEVDEKITPGSITSEDVQAYYEAHRDDFHRPRERRASQILVATQEEAEKVLAQAGEADARRFSQLAREHSLDSSTKLRGGDLGFFTEAPEARDSRLPKVHEAVRKAAFELKTVGDITPKPVAVDGQFAIVRLIGERPERHTELAQAESAIRSRLWRTRRREAVDQLIARLRESKKPQVFADRVDLVSFEGMDRRPSGFAPDPVRAPEPEQKHD